MITPPSPGHAISGLALDRRRLLTGAGGLAAGIGGAALLGASPAHASADRKVTYRAWTGRAFATGTLRGLVQAANGDLALSTRPTTRRALNGKQYAGGAWTSPWCYEPFAFTELIASWSASTPGDSWIQVEVRSRTASGAASSWDTLARWASGDAHVRRTTFGAQTDDVGRVNVDTWRSNSPAGLRHWQVRVLIYRREGARTTSPRVRSLGAMTSRIPTGRVAVSTPGPGRGKVLDVPRYSQMTHSGHYPRWGNGGQAWCSPTSTSMVLGYYDALPPAADRAWVPRGHTDPWVDHAARMVYDQRYAGCGNWPFNTAYAAQFVEQAFVTRLRSLREAEEFIAAGIPLIASISFARGELTGAPISATAGHLLVIVGFTSSGDVVVNDPASPTRAGVRRTYRRAEFENVWLPRSGGLVYVVRDASRALPSRGSRRNW